MAEYSEVIKQFKRMCRYTNHSGLPSDCPLYCKGHGCNISHCRLLAFDDKKFQNVVMTWAAEHPTSVYPTWGEWLESEGICFSRLKNYSRVAGVSIPQVFEYQIDGETAFICGDKVNKPIPADIAVKLGIEPKGEA